MDFEDVLAAILRVFAVLTGVAAAVLLLTACGFVLYWSATGVDVSPQVTRSFIACLPLAMLSFASFSLADCF